MLHGATSKRQKVILESVFELQQRKEEERTETSERRSWRGRIVSGDVRWPRITFRGSKEKGSAIKGQDDKWRAAWFESEGRKGLDSWGKCCGAKCANVQ